MVGQVRISFGEEGSVKSYRVRRGKDTLKQGKKG